MQEPAGIPSLSRRATVAAVAIVLLPLVAVAFNTIMLSRVRQDAGPPPLSIIPPLPDDVQVVREETGCTPGNWVRCWLVVEVEASGDAANPLADRLGDWYRDQGQDLYRWRQGWRHPDCSRETGICLAIDPSGDGGARIEISRMSDGL